MDHPIDYTYKANKYKLKYYRLKSQFNLTGGNVFVLSHAEFISQVIKPIIKVLNKNKADLSTYNNELDIINKKIIDLKKDLDKNKVEIDKLNDELKLKKTIISETETKINECLDSLVVNTNDIFNTIGKAVKELDTTYPSSSRTGKNLEAYNSKKDTYDLYIKTVIKELEPYIHCSIGYIYNGCTKK